MHGNDVLVHPAMLQDNIFQEFAVRTKNILAAGKIIETNINDDPDRGKYLNVGAFEKACFPG